MNSGPALHYFKNHVNFNRLLVVQKTGSAVSALNHHNFLLVKGCVLVGFNAPWTLGTVPGSSRNAG